MHLATLRGRLPGTAQLVQLGERMALRPIGHRILISPDAPPDETESGIVLPGDRDHVPVSGTVVAVGNGPARDATIRQAVILRCIGILYEMTEVVSGVGVDAFCGEAMKELRHYKNQAERFDSEIKVGDRVVYPVEAGIVVTEDGTDYILLNEDDVAVIATEEEAAA